VVPEGRQPEFGDSGGGGGGVLGQGSVFLVFFQRCLFTSCDFFSRCCGFSVDNGIPAFIQGFLKAEVLYKILVIVKIG
jgi:hypothetical protein